MTQKSYFLETDVLEASGILSLDQIGNKGNTIYLNFKELEEKSKDPKNRYAQSLKEISDYISNCIDDFGISENSIKLPKGGILRLTNIPENDNTSLKNLKNENENIIYITKNPHSKIKHAYNNEQVEGPLFMMYDPKTFEKGFLKLNYNLEKQPNDVTLDDLMKENEDKLSYVFNNQYILVNNSFLYKIQFPLIRTESSKERFSIDEDNPILKKIDLSYMKEKRGSVGNFNSRNIEQSIGYDLIKSKNTEIIFLTGGSGTGKTVVSYYAAIEMLLTEKITSHEKQKNKFNGIKLFKSYDIIGGKERELGFLPGTAYEKTLPFMKSYIDAHKLCGLGELCSFMNLLGDPRDDSSEFGKRKQDRLGEYYLPSKNPAIEIEHLQYARGRTFENDIILVDEAQNLTPYEMKQLVERVGRGSKVIVMGDPFEQIDNPRLDQNFNGLSYLASLYYSFGHPRMGMINLNENYRSQSAEISRRHKAPRV